jgi:2-keto-myo-inositol isomerase
MQIALNGATTMRSSLETDIAVAGQAGYDLIEIWGAKLDRYLEQHSPTDLAALLRKSGIAPYSINSIEHINLRTAQDYAGIKAACLRLSRIAQAISCPYVVVVPSPLPAGVGAQQVQDDAVGVLGDLSSIAAEYGVGLAFEMLGPPECSVNTLHDAWEIVRRVQRDNVGLVLDTFHFFLGGSTLSSIMDIDPAKLFIFHINDAEAGERATLTDAQRLLPGDGVIPLAEICRGLRNCGYKSMVSIELFRPEYWDWDPARLAREAKLKTETIINSVWS